MMKKITGYIALFALLGWSVGLRAQTVVLDQSMLTSTSFNSFSAFSITGTQTWTFSATYGAVCNGYSGGQNFENEDWLVSPAMNLLQLDNVRLSFSHTRGNAAVMNAGVTQGWYKVFATANFTGNPATTNWVEVTGVNQNVVTAWQYISSGEVLVPDAAKSANTRIAFRYMSSATQSATWEVKNVKVTGQPFAAPGTVKITNWNTEWLGCTTNGPSDENTQINNVVSAMLAMNSDIFCLQEISHSTTIGTLVALMGSDVWDGTILPANMDDCDQRQGIIYKKAKVQFVSSALLSNGSAAQGNSYYYNWSSGRYPAVYNVNLISGSASVPLSIVNIHAKSEDGVATSYTRRLGASQSMKTLLDGAAYNTRNLLIIGDYNDYLLGTSSTTCSCTVSPYKNFMDDTVNYNGVTRNLTNASDSFNHPVIENMIISSELFGNYVANSAMQEVTVAQGITNYFSTTSDHLPESAMFQFTALANPSFTTTTTLKLYPNPVKNELRWEARAEEDATISIYDLTGRLVRVEKPGKPTIDVSALPSGVYILKMGNRSGKFVKE